MKCILSSVLMLCFFMPVTAQRKYNNSGNAPLQLYMTQVGGGNFDLGSDDEATDRKPAHTVTVKDFSIGTYEVTQEQWKLVMGNNPSLYICEECPVTNISFADVQSFIEKLNTMTGKHYRLPTEAEWEYAARGGQKERLIKSTPNVAKGGVNELLVPNDGIRRVPDKELTGKKYSGKKLPQDVAWYARNSKDHIHPTGRKKSNELGIYDMSGNVEEWCADFYGKDYGSKQAVSNPQGPAGGNAHVVRGGSWSSSPSEITVTRRAAYVPKTKNNSLGFRVAMDK